MVSFEEARSIILNNVTDRRHGTDTSAGSDRPGPGRGCGCALGSAVVG